MNRHDDIYRLLISLIIVALIPSNSRGEPLESSTTAQVPPLESQLNSSDPGTRWNQLPLSELSDQIQHGPGADISRLSRVLSRFSSERLSLEMIRLAVVRVALTDWISSLRDGDDDETASPSSKMQPHLTESLANVATAAQRLDQFLQSGSPENAAAWKRFIKWETLQQQLTADVTDANQLVDPLRQLKSGEAGLELPPFVDLREALNEHSLKVLYYTNEQARSRYEQKRQTIIDALNSADFQDRDFAQLNSNLEFLDQLDFATDLIHTTRQRFRHPNLIVSASSDIITQSLSEPIKRSAPIRETILGTRVRGTAHLNGQLTARLLPSEESIRIGFLLNGQSISDTIGRQGPVSIFSDGYTTVTAQNALEIDADGFHAEPTIAQCTTRSQIRAIRAKNQMGRKLVEKIAWKQARQQLRQVEQIASRLAAKRIETNMDKTTRERVLTSNQDLRERLRDPLSRRRLYPRQMRFWSTTDRVHFVATEGRQSQLAAGSPPPSPPKDEFVVQLHETALLNVAINVIGGLKLTDENAVVLIEKATGKVPEEMAIRQDEDPWSITFDFQQPIRVTFDENRIKIVIRGRRFVRGNQVVRQATDIGATYDLSIADGRAKLQRVGDIEVTYPGKDPERRLSLTEIRNKTFLTNKFEGLFKSQIEGGNTKLPENLRNLEWLTELHLTSISADDGWLSLGWK